MYVVVQEVHQELQAKGYHIFPVDLDVPDVTNLNVAAVNVSGGNIFDTIERLPQGEFHTTSNGHRFQVSVSSLELPETISDPPTAPV